MSRCSTADGGCMRLLNWKFISAAITAVRSRGRLGSPGLAVERECRRRLSSAQPRWWCRRWSDVSPRALDPG